MLTRIYVSVYNFWNENGRNEMDISWKFEWNFSKISFTHWCCVCVINLCNKCNKAFKKTSCITGHLIKWYFSCWSDILRRLASSSTRPWFTRRPFICPSTASRLLRLIKCQIWGQAIHELQGDAGHDQVPEVSDIKGVSTWCWSLSKKLG